MPMLVVSPDARSICWHDVQTVTFQICWCSFQRLSTGVGGADQRHKGSRKGEGKMKEESLDSKQNRNHV